MAEGMRIDIEEVEKTIGVIESAVEEIKEKLNGIFTDYNAVLKDNPYKKLFDPLKKLEDEYNEKVLVKLKKETEEWANGDKGYVSLGKNLLGEDDDEGLSEMQEQQGRVVSLIEDLKEIQIIERPNFRETHFEVEDIKDRLEEIKESVQGLEEISESKEKELEKLKEENDANGPILYVGVTYCKSISNFMTNSAQKISLILGEKLDEKSKNTKDKESEANEKKEKFIQEIEDNINNMSDFLSTLFD